jgi:hypothetical protein
MISREQWAEQLSQNNIAGLFSHPRICRLCSKAGRKMLLMWSWNNSDVMDGEDRTAIFKSIPSRIPTSQTDNPDAFDNKHLLPLKRSITVFDA